MAIEQRSAGIPFAYCPHCRQTTQQRPIRVNGPEAKEVFLLGLAAYLLFRQPRMRMQCTNCHSILATSGKRLRGGKLFIIVLLLTVIGLLGVALFLKFSAR